MKSTSYVLISPVYNEASVARLTLDMVAEQTIPPTRWVIVDDGSTDGTSAVLEEFARDRDFVEVVTLGPKDTPSYLSRTRAVIAGSQRLAGTAAPYVGILDFDLRIPNDYYERVLEEFDKDPELGLAGGFVLDVAEGGLVTTLYRSDFVAGGVQMFRRECYEQIGGYREMPWGGDDTVAAYMAQRCGWKTRSFEDLRVGHLRPRAAHEASNRLGRVFKAGRKDRSIGYHPLYILAKSIRRSSGMFSLLDGLTRMSGFLWGAMVDRTGVLDPDFIAYVRKSQLTSVRSHLRL